MRELKFRIWIKDEKRYYDESDDESYQIIPNGQVVYTSEVYEEDGVFYRDTTNATDNVIIEQYTGLKDKNGKEIYEGDIVTLNGEWEEIEHGDCSIVTFENGCFRVDNGYENEAGSYLSDWRIIGNIHENQDLLGGTNVTDIPLIKDEKIRKAVRAWAEACGVNRVVHGEYDNELCAKGQQFYGAKIVLTKTVAVPRGRNYTIDELCGEEEECSD